MRTAAITLALMCWAFGANAQTCEYPQGVDMPDGRTATKEEMIAGQQQVKAYMAAMNAYLDCLDAETNASGDEPSEEEQKILVSRHNAAVDEMETIAASFNEQVRAYNAASSN